MPAQRTPGADGFSSPHIPGYSVSLYKLGMANGRALAWMHAPREPNRMTSSRLSPQTSAVRA